MSIPNCNQYTLIYTERARGTTVADKTKPWRGRIQDAPLILHFDPLQFVLTEWRWPLGRDGRPIDPSTLSEHRETHEFKAPCCLCAIVDAVPDKAIYTETSIFAKQKVNDLLVWQWIAACSTGCCKYYVILDRFFNRPAQPTFQYPLLGPTGSAAALPPAPNLTAFIDEEINDIIVPPAPGLKAPRRRRATISPGGIAKTRTKSSPKKAKGLEIVPLGPASTATTISAAGGSVRTVAGGYNTCAPVAGPSGSVPTDLNTAAADPFGVQTIQADPTSEGPSVFDLLCRLDTFSTRDSLRRSLPDSWVGARAARGT